MQYLSTRGGVFKADGPARFCDILLEGLAPDGGLAMPQSYPRVTAKELEAWRSLSYPELAFEVMHKFIDDIPVVDLRGLLMRTYTPQLFGNGEITPLKTLEPGLHLLGLSNGPTLAFKDVAMQFLGNVFEYVLAKEGRELNILGATSGDTGSSAEYAMRGKNGIRVFMLSPLGKMSPFQSAQMFSLQDPNIFNIAIDGVFDDCQDIVKAVSGDAEFKRRHLIGTVNSINWARVIAQVVYYFKGWFSATQVFSSSALHASRPSLSGGTIGEGGHSETALPEVVIEAENVPLPKVSFAIPSGNFGNICAGHIARMMGLPIHRLVCATNENDVLDEFFKSGVYRVRKSAETHQTSSPSMDISKASNFERFIFDLFEGDSGKVRALWRQVEVEGGFDLSGTDEFKGLTERFGFVSGRSTHFDRIQTIRHTFEEYDAVIDPHTADALKVARQHLDPGIPMVVLETALPVKFSETIVEALGMEPSRPDAFADIETLPQRFEVLSRDAEQVKAYMARHTGK